ncbi:hypothetical protein EV715DRAFT_261227 [Schizophyllum commune]
MTLHPTPTHALAKRRFDCAGKPPNSMLRRRCTALPAINAVATRLQMPPAADRDIGRSGRKFSMLISIERCKRSLPVSIEHETGGAKRCAWSSMPCTSAFKNFAGKPQRAGQCGPAIPMPEGLVPHARPPLRSENVGTARIGEGQPSNRFSCQSNPVSTLAYIYNILVLATPSQCEALPLKQVDFSNSPSYLRFLASQRLPLIFRFFLCCEGSAGFNLNGGIRFLEREVEQSEFALSGNASLELVFQESITAIGCCTTFALCGAAHFWRVKAAQMRTCNAPHTYEVPLSRHEAACCDARFGVCLTCHELNWMRFGALSPISPRIELRVRKSFFDLELGMSWMSRKMSSSAFLA